jgi:hypothetical protein
MTEVRRLHKCYDGVWRHAANHVQGVGMRLTKLDEDGRPTGQSQEIYASGCVHFSFEDE